MDRFCQSLTQYCRRRSGVVRVGAQLLGGDNPVAVQTMTNCSTLDTEACVGQIDRIACAGGRIVRLTTQGEREARNLAEIARHIRPLWPDVALVADVHFLPQVAMTAAETADKVRINPGNYNDRGGDFDALIELCRRRRVALRIGVNHGSLSKRMMDLYGDTPEGMVASAMEFLRILKEKNFTDAVVSLKSSNVRVMVYAYRMLAVAMDAEQMDFPIHLGVTEAGNDAEGRVKSAVGIGALLADGIGDTIRVSLTEAPEREIPAARILADRYTHRRPVQFAVVDESALSAFSYVPRPRSVFGEQPFLWSELTDEQRASAAVFEAESEFPVQEWRSAVMNRKDSRPVILRRCYSTDNLERLQIEAAADFGVMFIDSLADGIDIVDDNFSRQELDSLALMILQAARVRFSHTEYIACPSCGRTLYDIESALAAIKARTNHLRGLKIGVMGCIVNGPGEMADADYGYVGGAPGCISLYRAGLLVKKNIPQSEAVEALVDLIKADGRWQEPK